MNRPPALLAGSHAAHAHPPPNATGTSWLVWLRWRDRVELSPAQTAMEAAGTAHAMGHCLFVLPRDGAPHAWCRRGGRAALLVGHLLNREELRRRLELPPSPPPTDAELLLAAHATWGAAAAGELEGSFAAIVWDEPRETLLCIRDALGAMPLFYAQSGTGLAVSGDVRTLRSQPGVSHEINRVVLAEHLLWRHWQLEETFFAGVRRLPGAHLLAAQGTEVRVVRYWDPLPPGQPIDWLDPAELAEFPRRMEQTLAACLALGPAAVSLSSGIDSVSVAAFAAEVAAARGGPRPEALAVHFDDPTWDESTGQRAVADSLDLPLRLLSAPQCLRGRRLLDRAMAAAAEYPSPLINLWEPLLTHLLDEAQHQGIQVMLTGIGGDEWLCVTPLLAADLLRSGRLASLWHLYRTALRSYEIAPLSLAREMLWRFGLRAVLKDAACRHFPAWVARRRRPVELPDWIAPDLALRRQLAERLQPPPPAPTTDSAYLDDLRPVLQSPHVTMLLEEHHYRGRRRGISYFHPYWSRPLVELLLRTPPHLLNDGGRAKGFLRRALAERFPRLPFAAKKVTRNPFFATVLSQQWQETWRQWSAGSALVRDGLVDGPRLETAMQQAADGRSGYLSLWLFTEAWLRGQA
jgi:asparagine synthase (glutamine-hydrolysing)